LPPQSCQSASSSKALLVNESPFDILPALKDGEDVNNATVGFEALAEDIHKPAKSLHRMLSKSGNPTMSNISAIFAAIKRALKVEIRTQILVNYPALKGGAC